MNGAGPGYHIGHCHPLPGLAMVAVIDQTGYRVVAADACQDLRPPPVTALRPLRPLSGAASSTRTVTCRSNRSLYLSFAVIIRIADLAVSLVCVFGMNVGVVQA